jgi:hypothetical protein
MPEGRFYVKSTPATRGEVESPTTDPTAAGVDGEFYLSGAQPIEQASVSAGQPVTREERQAAKKEQTAADKAAAAAGTAPDVADPAAETTQEEPVEAASQQAGDPPVETTNHPAKNASRGEWADYAKSQGMSEEDLKGLSRNDIRDRYTLL